MVIGTACAGRIESVVELHQGRLSDYVAEVVTDRGSGGFAQPGDIVASCVMRMWRYDHDVQSMRQPCRPESAAGWTSVRSSLRASGVDETELIGADAGRDTLAGRWSPRRRAAARGGVEGNRLDVADAPAPAGSRASPSGVPLSSGSTTTSRHVEKTLTYRPPSATSDRLACRLRVDVSRRVKVFRSEPDARAARAERCQSGSGPTANVADHDPVLRSP